MQKKEVKTRALERIIVNMRNNEKINEKKFNDMESTALKMEREKENIIECHNQEIQRMKGDKDRLLLSKRTDKNELRIVKMENDRLTAENLFLISCSQIMAEEKRHTMNQKETEEGKGIDQTCDLCDSKYNDKLCYDQNGMKSILKENGGMKSGRKVNKTVENEKNFSDGALDGNNFLASERKDVLEWIGDIVKEVDF